MEFLNKIIGDKTTLIVTCFECSNRMKIDPKSDCYEHTSLANCLDLSDDSTPDLYDYYVARLGVGRIVIIGSPQCYARQELLEDADRGDFGRAVRGELTRLIRAHHLDNINTPERNVLLTEMTLIHQARKLMALPRIFDEVKHGRVSVHAITIDPDRNFCKEIFRNGIRFNDLISMQ